MIAPAGHSRLSLAQAAFVIARRDFRAILFSKAFVFFLIGPVFFGLISLGAASIGQRTAENREPPILAVSMDPVDAAAIEVARNRLHGMVDLPAIERVDTGADPAKVLADRSRNYGGVLTGGARSRWPPASPRGAGPSIPKLRSNPPPTAARARSAASPERPPPRLRSCSC